MLSLTPHLAPLVHAGVYALPDPVRLLVVLIILAIGKHAGVIAHEGIKLLLVATILLLLVLQQGMHSRKAGVRGRQWPYQGD
jgi:hypothetical protein